MGQTIDDETQLPPAPRRSPGISEVVNEDLNAKELLTSLLVKLSQDPAKSFVDLAAILTSRGHLMEALRVTEHGLQVVPHSAEGRTERAAALLTLDRPRAAYLELVRALAIEPNHRRALRLMGQVYKETGAPEKAAALLTGRMTDSEVPSTVLVLDNSQYPEKDAEEASQDSMTLISNLANSLNLSLNETIPNIEATQITKQRAPSPNWRDPEPTIIDHPIYNAGAAHNGSSADSKPLEAQSRDQTIIDIKPAWTNENAETEDPTLNTHPTWGDTSIMEAPTLTKLNNHPTWTFESVEIDEPTQKIPPNPNLRSLSQLSDHAESVSRPPSWPISLRNPRSRQKAHTGRVHRLPPHPEVPKAVLSSVISSNVVEMIPIPQILQYIRKHRRPLRIVGVLIFVLYTTLLTLAVSKSIYTWFYPPHSAPKSSRAQ
ncbi:MAG: tetratricopeptide repeat protein [Myxococcales bacterium]|nr:tetratricopeptide repeat protein [Myxococcales bacterium]